jgi:hypothetical protein
LPFPHCHGICKILNVEIESIDTVQGPGVLSKDFKRVVEALPVWKEMKLDWLLRKASKEEVRS